MIEHLLLCAKRHNVEDCIQLAQEYQIGIEVQTFAYPPLFPDGWRNQVHEYANRLQDVPGEIALHGPFMDLAGGSFDPLINDVVRQRVEQTLYIADELDATTLVFHANFIATIRNPEYRHGWIERQVAFWRPLAEAVWSNGRVIALENMWEFDPDILGHVVQTLDLPGLRACLDVGHTSLFSDLPLDHWLARLDGMIAHVHLNNNNGELDYHRGLDEGVLNYHAIMPLLRRINPPPSISLEIEDAAAIRRSLEFLKRVT